MPDFEKLTAQEEQALMALFEDARAEEPDVSEGLLARVMADAADVGVTAPVAAPVSVESNWRARISDIFGQLGGLPGASVMTACAIFGLSLGYAGPDSLLSVTGLSDAAFVTTEFDSDIDLFQTTGFGFDEGELLQ